MTHRLITRTGFAAALCLLAAPALSDEPGPGGTKPFIPVTGEQVYRTVCQACHMADGKGGIGAGAIPALANNPGLAAPAYPIILVTQGRGAMPWFGDLLSARQMAGVITYIRTHFGNTYAEPVTEADIAKYGVPTPPAAH